MAVTLQESGSLNTISNQVGSFTAGAGVANDDLWIMTTVYNQPTVVPGTPSGWTAFSNGTVTPSASMQTKAFWKWAVSGDSSTAQGWTGTTYGAAARKGIVWQRFRGVDKTKWNAMTDAQRLAVMNALNAATETVPTLSVVGSGGGNFVTGSQWLERSSTPTASGTITYPSGYTAGAGNTFGTGGGTCHGAAAHNLTVQTSSVGSGQWGNQNAGGVVVYTFALPEGGSNVPPVSNAGSDQVNIEPGATVTLDGTSSDSDGSVSSAVWSQTAGTPSVTLSNSGNDPCTFEAPATVAGTTLTFRQRVTDNGGAITDDTMTVTVLPAEVRAAIGGVLVGTLMKKA